jgi:hypothetical protein
VLRETTSRGLCGVVCPSRTCATRDSVYYCCFYLFIQYRVLCVFITAGPSTKLFTWGVFITALCVRVYLLQSGSLYKKKNTGSRRELLLFIS